MERSRLLRATAVLLAATAVLAAACIRYRNQTVLLADGSGRMTVTTAMRLPKRGALGDLPAPRPADDVLAGIVGDVEGAVAITDATERDDGEWRTRSYQLWFEDVNRVRIFKGTGRERRAITAFRLQREADGLVLEATDSSVREEAARLAKPYDDIDAAPEEQRAILRKFADAMNAMTAGLDVRLEVRMPGEITAVAVFERSDARTAVLAVTDADLKDPEKVRRLARGEAPSVRCGRSVVTAAESAQFRVDLDRAKRQWAASPLAREVTAKRRLQIETGGRVHHVAATRDGARIAALLSADRVAVWDAKGAKVAESQFDPRYPERIRVLGDGSRVLAEWQDKGTAACFECATGRRVWSAEDQDPVKDPSEGWRSAKWSCLPLPSGEIVVGREATSLLVLDGATGAKLRDLPGTWEIDSLAAAGPPGSFVVAEPRRIARVDARTGAVAWSRDVPEGVAWRSLAAGGAVAALCVRAADGTAAPRLVRALAVADGRVLWSAPMPRNLEGVDVSPTGRLVLLRGFGEAALLEGATGRALGRVRSDAPLEGGLAFGADDATLLSWERMPDDDTAAIDVHRLELPMDLAPPPPAAPGRK